MFDIRIHGNTIGHYLVALDRFDQTLFFDAIFYRILSIEHFFDLLEIQLKIGLNLKINDFLGASKNIAARSNLWTRSSDLYLHLRNKI